MNGDPQKTIPSLLEHDVSVMSEVELNESLATQRTTVSMNKLTKTEVITGVFWVEVPEADVFVLCGCPEDTVKHLMQRGLIHTTEKDGVEFETGPNVIVLSDVSLQNGSFCNLAEFPVLQMLYRQGMILPGHPNNTGVKPMLVGSNDQISAQMQYIYRGNYGLTSKEEIMATGASSNDADEIMRMKLKFAFGRILDTEELLDHRSVNSQAIEVRNGVFVKRVAANQFEISYGDEAVTVDLNLKQGESYRSPYPLGFQNIPREYFAVVHSGQGDGWDTNRPCMSSVLIYQGKVYLIDAGSNISYSLTALGIGVNEIEGIFHTHCHDDHFSGLTTLIRTDHRVKYFATPLVRASVFKKLSALLSIDEEMIANLFDVHDLECDVWNDIEGLEIRPFLSPHPVETTVMNFRAFWEGRYLTYAHLADIASFDVLKEMIAEPDAPFGISQDCFDRTRKEYLTHVELKKIDIGGGMIHGQAEDFQRDTSDKIILAHQSLPLTSFQKEIGSSAPFGVVDVLIPDRSDNLRRFAFEFLRAYFQTMDRHYLRTLLNCPIVEFMPGSIILKKGQINDEIFLVLTGNVERISSKDGIYNMISAGGLIGEYSGMHAFRSNSTYRSVSFVSALRLPSKLYVEFIRRGDLYQRIERLYESREFLERTWLFGESISPSVQNRIAEAMVVRNHKKGDSGLDGLDLASVGVVKSGEYERLLDGEVVEKLTTGSFFGEERVLFNAAPKYEYRAKKAGSICEIPGPVILDIPILMWKLLETYERRAA